MLFEELRQIVQGHFVLHEDGVLDHDVFDGRGALGHQQIADAKDAFHALAPVHDVGVLNVVVPVLGRVAEVDVD